MTDRNLIDRTDRKIIVADTLVPKPLQRSISEYTRKPIWQYGWQSNSRRDRHFFWHAHFAGGDGRSRRNCLLELMDNAQAQPSPSPLFGKRSAKVS